MLILFFSFLAGMLSVLAPCVLPVIPVIFAGGLSAETNARTLRILFSALFCIFLFTFILKVSTAFIAIPTSTRATLSGLIIVLYGCTLLFPQARENISQKLPKISTSRSTQGNRGDYLLGASLGPIFATCSPTYSLLLATILPASPLLGIAGILAYLAGFGGFLYILILGGRSLVQKFYGLANNNGIFKKILSVILIITGILIASGAMKTLESKLIGYVPDVGKIENNFTAFITPNGDATNILALSTGSTMQHYRNYDPQNMPSSGDIVLFFHADWCPSCQQAEKNFLASGIPDGLTILKVNFDTETKLKLKYGILSQTSFAYIKPDGTLIKRWVGGRDIQDILSKIAEAKANSGTKLGSQAFLPDKGGEPLAVEGLPTTSVAYFAGGCFRCMEGPFEAMDGVTEVINGYAGGSKETADYETVSTGRTKHREAVKVVYNPNIVSYRELLSTYRSQIDPTDAGGQFADRGYQYTTAIFTQTETEDSQAEQSKVSLQQAKKFDKDIAVQIIPFESFYPAEDYHQDYYKKNSTHYNSYKKGSGREDFIHKNEDAVKEIFEISPNGVPSFTRGEQEQKFPDLTKLTPEQKHILFEGGTEPPFKNAYWDNHQAGIYVDVIDGTPLFSSTDKFDSGTGRPSFSRPIDESVVKEDEATSHPFYGTEVEGSGSRHLGHVFDDGPTDKGGQRYCINSAALRFVPLADMEKEGYGKYLKLFEK